jgi:N-acyl-D-amino-acid deacylase
MFDLIFHKAKIVDGTGNPFFYGDVGIEGDKITAVGDLSTMSAKRTINVDGMVLAPGFIDLHTHSDFTLPLTPRADSMVRQGVTTQLVGNCGFSPFPILPENAELMTKSSSFLGGGGLSWDWNTAAEYMSMLDALPLAANVACQVGHCAIRMMVMGYDNREPTPAELIRMEQLVAQAFEDGVFSLSSGLIYVPGTYCKTDELIALAKVAAKYNGFYSSHIRGEGETLLDAVNEAITIGRSAGTPVQLSHHKAAGKRNWGKVEKSLALLDEARGRGEDVLADQYPYVAGSTTLAAILPTWVSEGGEGLMRERLANPESRQKIMDEMLNGKAEFSPDTIMISAISPGDNQKYEGKMLTEIAAERNEPILDAAFHLLTSEPKGVQMITFAMSEEDVKRVMQHPSVAVASDGWTLTPKAGGKPHPRSYGTFVRVLGKYVREENVIGLSEAVRKMTSLPAQRLRRYDLGLIRPGCTADLVVFNPDTVQDKGTFADPHQFCEGVHYVVVNGQIVIENDEDTGAIAGKVFRRPN